MANGRYQFEIELSSFLLCSFVDNASTVKKKYLLFEKDSIKISFFIKILMK